MKTRTILSTALLGVTLLFPAPPPEAKARPALPLVTVDQMCAAFGTFAYNRALERNRGATFSHAQERSTFYDVSRNVDLAVRQYHQEIVEVVYLNPGHTPL